MRVFFDTNILVYAATRDPRRRRAHQILRAGGIVSVQVLNEFANVAHNKLRHPWDVIEYALNQFRLSLDAVWPITLDTHIAALALARNSGFSFYDALIVSSAVEAGCHTLYTEDMQHGQAIGALTIRNPFREGT